MIHLLSRWRSRLKQFFYQSSIQKLMALLIAFSTILSTIAIAGFAYILSEQIIQRKISQYCNDILAEISNNIYTELREVNSLTTYICASETVQSQIRLLNSVTDSRKLLEKKQTLEKELINLTVASNSFQKLTIVTSSQQTAWISRPNPETLSDTNLRKLISDGQGSLCWITQKSNGTSQIIAGREIYDLATQKSMGYLLVNFDSSRLQKILAQKEYFKNGDLSIVDGNGLMIANNQSDASGSAYPYPELLDKTSDGMKIPGSNDWFSSCRIAETDWQLISTLSNVNYEKEIHLLRIYIFLIAFFIIFFTIAVTVRITRRLFSPFKELCSQMESVGKGNFAVTRPSNAQLEVNILYDSFLEMVDEIQNLIRTTNQQQILLQKTELNSLRMQINPHFIYNTLESIKWMAYMNGNQEIVTMVKSLGDFMRNSISGGEFITLESELENIQCYLTIQRFRYEDKLNVSIDIDPELLRAEIPKFILQPLIENSITHGLEQKISGGEILIQGYQEGKDILLKVIDNGLGFTSAALEHLNLDLPDPAESKRKGGYGMKNVHQRIRLYYGPEYGLTIQSEYGIRTEITIRLPLKTV